MKALILAGGHSSRMGLPKSLLPFIDGRPIIQHTLEIIQCSCPDLEDILISVRDHDQRIHLTERLHSSHRIICDRQSEGGESDRDIGPAAGLLAAYEEDASTSWLIVACDYPLLRVEALQYLRHEYKWPVTCFKNAEGWREPLLAIWSSTALQRLHANVQNELLSPNRVIADLDGKTLFSPEPSWLTNTNTKAEWEAAIEIARRYAELN